jgi:hypothetical protein
MLKLWIAVLVAFATLGACAPMTPATESSASPSIQGTPGKAVVYIIRTRPDVSYLTAPLVLDDRMIGASYAGTHFRLELDPGRHRLSGYASDNGAINLDVKADRIYFVQHTVSGSWRAVNPHSFFRLIDESRARSAIAGTSRAG